MKKLLPILIISLLALTSCKPTENSSPFESHEELIEVINSQADLECSTETVDTQSSLETDEEWDSMSCADGGIVHYLRSEGAKTHLLDWLEQNDTSNTRVGAGDDWIFVGHHTEASAVRNALSGTQPTFARPEPTTTPTPTPTPTTADFEVSCRDEDRNESGIFTSLEDVWDELSLDERYKCDVSLTRDYSETELEAIEVADSREQSLHLLYGICASSHLGDHKEIKKWSGAQLQEVEGALILCPDHPERAIIEDRTAEAVEAEAQREHGERFRNGTHRVGDDIQPGTYVVEVDEAFDGCYWQRLDAAGNTIDNNFINSGFRAEATIAASDYSFTSERCGEWAKQ